jgi:hypothetical protein
MMSSVFLCFMYSNRHRFNRIPAGRVASASVCGDRLYQKEMPNLDSVNHCTSKAESRFSISKFGIEIRSLMYAGIGCNENTQNYGKVFPSELLL